MKIGVMTPATVEAGDIAAIAREAENLGYESFFIPEHPVIPIGFKTVPPGGGTLPEHYGRWMDPFVALAVAAAVTKHIKLGTGICLLPEREPLVTAKAIATLDIVSGGRVILGVGAGWLKEETEATGAQFRYAMETAARDRRGAALAMDRTRAELSGRIRPLRAPPMRSQAGTEGRSADSARGAWPQGAGTRRSQL